MTPRAAAALALLAGACVLAHAGSLTVRDADSAWTVTDDPQADANDFLLKHLVHGTSPDERFGRGGQTAFTLGASKFQVVTTVLIPAAMPQIFDSFRVMNAIAWTYIILAEIVNAKEGIGFILHMASQHNKPDWSFAGILVVGVIGIITDVIIRILNRVLFGWREADA